jgi:hypothetical protein
MLNQNQTEPTPISAVYTGVSINDTTSCGEEISENTEAEENNNFTASVSLRQAQNQQNGAEKNARTEENLYECQHLTGGATHPGIIVETAGVPQRQTNLHELQNFQGKRKRIAIMSEVAATGDSLHSDKRAVNQQRREHIAAELKWSTDKQLQDFGRSHRSNQASPPVYLLIYTELGGEKRFSTLIARRLANTGTLNKGDWRDNQISGLERFNLESKEGRAALKIVYDRILAGFPIPDLENPKQALTDMGLLAKSENENEEQFLRESEKQNIVRFFNRSLSLEVGRQNALFEYFYKTYTETVEHLKASGKYDLGLEDIKAKSVKIRREPQLIHRDDLTGTSRIKKPQKIFCTKYACASLRRKLTKSLARRTTSWANCRMTRKRTGKDGTNSKGNLTAFSMKQKNCDFSDLFCFLIRNAELASIFRQKLAQIFD